MLVTSTLTKGEQESDLRDKLDNAPNVKIFDNYIPNIEEIYQMADVYLFPTVEECNCIDVPLSCMEAAACGKPVVTTAYGEMSEFKDVSGFYFIESFAPEELNLLIENALAEGAPHSGAAVKDYDWGGAVLQLLTE